MSKKAKVILFGAAGLAVVCLLTFYFTTSGEKKVDVNVETVKASDLVETVSASGRIQPQTKVNITAEVNAKIIALPVREGDTVKRGDQIIVLDTVQVRSDVDQARFGVSELNARLEQAKAQLDQAQEDFDRNKALFEQKLISETEFNNIQYAFRAQKSSYDAAQASARQFQSRYEKELDNLRKSRITAPMDGVITLVDCEVGEVAAAQTAFTQGKTLMTISNMNVFEVEVEVDETEIAKIELGQPTKIEVDAFPDTSFAGEVVEIGNTAIFEGLGTQDQSTNFKVKVTFKDTNAKIRPGMSATVDITSNRRDKVLAVPYAAVVMRSMDPDSMAMAEAPKSGTMVAEVNAAETSHTDTAGTHEKKEKKGVFVVRDGKAVFIEVSTGIADQQRIEVASGLKLGDSVITGPYRTLRTIKQGEAVKPSKDMGNGQGGAKT